MRINTTDCNSNIGKKVTICGRVHKTRNHGRILFIDLIDEKGIIQTISKNQLSTKEEDFIQITGQVKKRPQNLVNDKLETGSIEIEIEDLKTISSAKTPPIPTEGEGYEIDENLRLKYRYLDLRRERMQKNIRLRHKIATLARNYLNSQNFIEIETPYLSKTTPEGSRDFLVPSRLQKGKFYALAQSPQQYKQLLMVSGFEKYYQFARAFRDEDMRSDRQYEHTQIDIEMAYAQREDIMDLVEKMYLHIAKELKKEIKNDPFPVITYKNAMEKYGQDKFDLRTKEESEKLAFAWVVDFPLLEYVKEEKRYTFSHNPFCAPKEEYLDDVLKGKNLDNIISYQYDLVLNGEEVGGGSVRITDPKLQKQVLSLMGYSNAKITSEFGQLLDAYEYAAPNHAGIALGLDRLCAILSNEKSIREVIAFPASGSGISAVFDAPTLVNNSTLKELAITSTISKNSK